MSGTYDLRIEPATAAGAPAPVQPIAAHPAYERELREAAERARTPEPAATTGGQLRPAYAEFFVNPETESVELHIRDASTNEVIRQFPYAEVQSMNKFLRDYAETLARRRAVTQAQAGL
jgi:hypothetical protein